MVEQPPSAGVPLTDEITDLPNRHSLHHGQRKRFKQADESTTMLPGLAVRPGLIPEVSDSFDWPRLSSPRGDGSRAAPDQPNRLAPPHE